MRKIFRLARAQVASLWSHSLTVDSIRPGHVTLRADGMLVTVDKETSAVTVEGRIVATFDSIDSVEVETAEGRPVTSFNPTESIDIDDADAAKRSRWWRVQLRSGSDGSVLLGESDSFTNASTAATLVAAVIGSSVRTICAPAPLPKSE